MTAPVTEQAPSSEWPEGAVFCERFWSHVDIRGENDCWEWKLYRTKKGYGSFQLSRRHGPKRAHRVAYYLHTGTNPGDLRVRHSCDNPPCCNPVHLRLGTDLDNVRDMIERGRKSPHLPPSRGSKNGRAKLNEVQVAEIRERYGAGGITQVALAKEHHVSHTLIHAIVKGVIW
jgi:hypothetical protein